jgi:hypothetical protein
MASLFPVVNFVLHVLHFLSSLPPEERADGHDAHNLLLLELC